MTPHDYITNLQKRLGNRVWVGGGECRLCGSFLDPHSWNMAESLQHHRSHAGNTVHAFTMWCAVENSQTQASPRNPRGLTASQSRPADIFTTAAVPGRSAALDVCVASSNAAAARGDRRRHLIANCHTTGTKFREARNQGIHYRPPVLDSRMATTPSLHSNTAARSRHCI